MEKIICFSEWIVAISEVFDIDKNSIILEEVVNNKFQRITYKQFVNKVLATEGWQQVMMTTVDYICANNCFKNGTNFSDADIKQTKKLILKYFVDFTRNAISAGYSF